MADLKKKKQPTTVTRFPNPYDRSTTTTTTLAEENKGLDLAGIKNKNELAIAHTGPMSAKTALDTKLRNKGLAPKPDDISAVQEIFSPIQGLLPESSVTQQPISTADQRGFLKKFEDYTSPIPRDSEGYLIDRNTGERILSDTGEPQKVLTGTAPIATQAGVTSLFRAGGKLFPSASKAVQAGNSAKTASSMKPTIDTLQNVALFFVGAKALGGFNFNSEVDEAQQALNTIGQTTSTIVGESTSGAGDWREGLKQLGEARNTILELEQKIKQGKIRNATIKINGKVLDIDADVEDALSTVNEGIADIRTFALQGQFPQLSEQELQAYIAQLESEGYIKRETLSANRI